MPLSGVGPAKAAQLLAAVELGRRTLTPTPDERPQFLKPEDAATYLLAAFGARPTEHFGVVLLDTKHRVIKTAVVAVGALNATAVEPREVFREAIAGGAAGIVVFHNHPSGDPYPSPEDVVLTRRLLSAANVVGIELMDHIVLGDARYCSLKEMNRI